MEQVKQTTRGARRHGESSPGADTTGVLDDVRLKAILSRNRKRFSIFDANIWFFLSLVVVVFVSILVWRVLTQGAPGIYTAGAGDGDTRGQTGDLPDLVTQTEVLTERIAGLTERLDMMEDSITYLESKLIRAHVIADSLITAEGAVASAGRRQASGPAAGAEVESLPATSAGAPAAEEAPVRIVDAQPAAADVVGDPKKRTSQTAPKRAGGAEAELQGAMQAMQRTGIAGHGRGSPAGPSGRDSGLNQASGGSLADAGKARAIQTSLPPVSAGSGRWFINLASLASRGDADLFIARARAGGVPVAQQRVTLDGKTYWRVQTGGYDTAQEARSHVDDVRQALGLNDVWILKR